MPDKNKKRLTGLLFRKELEAACRGLVYISETNGPIDPIFEAFQGETTLREFVADTVSDYSVMIIEKPSALFFDKLTLDRDWHSDDDAKAVGKYRMLRKLLDEHLTELTMFRAGRVRVEIFVLGRDSEGNIAGIRTTAVET